MGKKKGKGKHPPSLVLRRMQPQATQQSTTLIRLGTNLPFSMHRNSTVHAHTRRPESCACAVRPCVFSC
jgi:hypothetical protein